MAGPVMLLGCDGRIDNFRSLLNAFLRLFGGSGPSVANVFFALEELFFVRLFFATKVFFEDFFAGFFLDVFDFAMACELTILR
jgi:hypothetical protein